MLKRVLPVLMATLFFTVATAQKNPGAAHFKAGIALKKNNKFPEALAAFNKAVALNKKYDSAYVEIGNLYSGSGNTDLGIYHYKKALTLNPKYTDALIGMGKLYRDGKRNMDSALYYYIRASRIDSTNKETFYGLAWIYNTKKDYDNAIINGVKALQIDNNYKPGYQELGHAYNASKRYPEALEQFKKNLAVSKVDIAMLYSGYIYIELKNKPAALEQYAELNKINERMAAGLKMKIDMMKEQN